MRGRKLSVLRTEPVQTPLRERNKLDKLARIERAGRRLFATRGFDATTTRAIAGRAGIGVGTLFLYFPEKKDLLIHLFHRDVAAVEEEIFATLRPDASLRTGFEHVFTGLYDYYARDLALSRVFIQELLFLDAERRRRVTAFTADFLARLATMAAAAQRRREIAPRVDTGQLAYAAFGLYCFTLINWLGGILPGPAAARAHLRAGLDLLFAGLTT
jgi:TetR/AcrR family transcriptional regulator, cholesterol catabolism regulator